LFDTSASQHLFQAIAILPEIKTGARWAGVWESFDLQHGSVPGGSSQIAGRVRQPARSCRCGASLLRRVREVSLRTLTGIRASLHETARA
jgi:hypothetical protein